MNKHIKHALVFIGNITWGLPMTIIGFLVSIFFMCMPKRFRKYCMITYVPCWYPGAWSMGLFLFIPHDCKDSVNLHRHEYGHTVQNAILGPFQIIIELMSLISFFTAPSKHSNRWFEKWADKLGGVERD